MIFFLLSFAEPLAYYRKSRPPAFEVIRPTGKIGDDFPVEKAFKA